MVFLIVNPPLTVSALRFNRNANAENQCPIETVSAGVRCTI